MNIMDLSFGAKREYARHIAAALQRMPDVDWDAYRDSVSQEFEGASLPEIVKTISLPTGAKSDIPSDATGRPRSLTDAAKDKKRTE